MTSQTPTIFTLPLTDLSRDAIIATALKRSAEEKNTWIATVNPEILLHAHRDAAYHATLQKADMRVVDGFGAKLFSGVQHRITGVELTMTYLSYAAEHQLSVLCIVRPDGLSSPAAIQATVAERYPGINLTVTTPQDDYTSIAKTLSPKIVLCSVGFPNQETILEALQSYLHGAVSIGVGGTFDFLLGTQARAPKIFQTLGIEWLWRLIQQPTRIKRIVNAVIVFPLTVLFGSKK